MRVNKIIQGNVLEVLKTLPDESIDCIVTSPPYYGLRDYGMEGQLGLEKNLEEFFKNMLLVTFELKRVLKKTGTLWWNHGDSYANRNANKRQGGGQKIVKDEDRKKAILRSYSIDFPEKSLMLQAHRLAIRMIDEQGWVLRNQIIWHKPNVMPASVEDRFTVDFEPIFFFAKSKKYYFERQFEPMTPEFLDRMQRGYEGDGERGFPGGVQNHFKNYFSKSPEDAAQAAALGRNKRAVWKISTKPFGDAHFATFPTDLIEVPIKAGCPLMICKKCGKAREPVFEPSEEYAKNLVKNGGNSWHDHSDDLGKGFGQQLRGNGKISLTADYKKVGYTDCGCGGGWSKGIVLDPFMGSGTTAEVARMLGRDYLGIELNPEYIKIAEKRLAQMVLGF